jgi:hypothetical protein
MIQINMAGTWDVFCWSRKGIAFSLPSEREQALLVRNGYYKKVEQGHKDYLKAFPGTASRWY